MLFFEQAQAAEARRLADMMQAAACSMGGGNELAALIEKLRAK